MPHLNNGKANQKGVWAIGHAPTQIPSISTLFKVIAPPLATSHSGGTLVVVVVRGGQKSRGQTRGLLLPPHAILIYNMACLNFGVFIWLDFGYNIWFDI
jgi:hypothetical protein